MIISTLTKYSKQLDIDCQDDDPVDLSFPKKKCIGAQWLVRLHEYLDNSPWIIVNPIGLMLILTLINE